ncbi:hypothetical protein [Nocardia beijingensis]|uniref:hypothetical protein n=1 Tax=Nocardia beijingensis TaxID=95162 RepID=UPI00082AF5D2
MATSFHVSLGSAQWTLTVALLSGAVATPVLGRLGAGPHRRAAILATPDEPSPVHEQFATAGD